MTEHEPLISTTDFIKIQDIRTDGGTQPRAKIDQETLESYIQSLQAGDQFPPVIVFYDGEHYWLADGFHRVKAHRESGWTDIAAEIKTGTRRDAILYSVGANTTHGLRRTNADKRRIVETLLSDSEWRQWSDRKIASHCKVSHPLVGQIRQELFGRETDEDSPVSASTQPRLAQRGGKTYTVNISKIGNSSFPEKQTASQSGKIKRQRKEKHINRNLQPIIPASPTVRRGELWQLGQRHQLFCGTPSSRRFQALLPDKVALLLLFPSTPEEWLPSIPLDAKSVLAFHSTYFEEMHLETLRNLISSCISGTTDSDDMVVMLNLPDPCSFLLIEAMDCNSLCAETNPTRCEEAIAAWGTSKQSIKKIKKV